MIFFLPLRSDATAEFCQGGTIEIHGNVYDQPQTIVDTLFTPDGCDSIVTTILTFSNALSSMQAVEFCEAA